MMMEQSCTEFCAAAPLGWRERVRRLLDDPVMRLVMRADGSSPAEILAILEELAGDAGVARH